MSDILIDSKMGEVALSFNLAFYGRGAIEQAAKDFEESCLVSVGEEKEGRISVALKPKEGLEIGLEELGNEFCNYVLGLIQNAIY